MFSRNIQQKLTKAITIKDDKNDITNILKYFEISPLKCHSGKSHLLKVDTNILKYEQLNINSYLFQK